MKSISSTGPRWLIWRPTVLVTIVYVFLLSLFWLWIFLTLKFDAASSEAILGPRIGGFSLYALFTMAHVGLALVLLFDLWSQLRGSEKRDRIQVVSLFCALLLVLTVQWGTEALKDMAERLGGG